MSLRFNMSISYKNNTVNRIFGKCLKNPPKNENKKIKCYGVFVKKL